MSFLVFFSANRAFFSLRVLEVVAVLALATEDKVTTCLNHDFLSAVHAHNAEHFIRD